MLYPGRFGYQNAGRRRGNDCDSEQVLAVARAHRVPALERLRVQERASTAYGLLALTARASASSRSWRADAFGGCSRRPSRTQMIAVMSAQRS